MGIWSFSKSWLLTMHTFLASTTLRTGLAVSSPAKAKAAISSARTLRTRVRRSVLDLGISRLLSRLNRVPVWEGDDRKVRRWYPLATFDAGGSARRRGTPWREQAREADHFTAHGDT